MKKIVGAVIGVIGVVVLLSLMFVFPVKWLWNWLMPEIFGLQKITAWQALGLLLLSGFLFRTSSSSSKN